MFRRLLILLALVRIISGKLAAIKDWDSIDADDFEHMMDVSAIAAKDAVKRAWG